MRLKQIIINEEFYFDDTTIDGGGDGSGKIFDTEIRGVHGGPELITIDAMHVSRMDGTVICEMSFAAEIEDYGTSDIYKMLRLVVNNILKWAGRSVGVLDTEDIDGYLHLVVKNEFDHNEHVIQALDLLEADEWITNKKLTNHGLTYDVNKSGRVIQYDLQHAPFLAIRGGAPIEKIPSANMRDLEAVADTAIGRSSITSSYMTGRGPEYKAKMEQLIAVATRNLNLNHDLNSVNKALKFAEFYFNEADTRERWPIFEGLLLACLDVIYNNLLDEGMTDHNEIMPVIWIVDNYMSEIGYKDCHEICQMMYKLTLKAMVTGYSEAMSDAAIKVIKAGGLLQPFLREMWKGYFKCIRVQSSDYSIGGHTIYSAIKDVIDNPVRMFDAFGSFNYTIYDVVSSDDVWEALPDSYKKVYGEYYKFE